MNSLRADELRLIRPLLSRAATVDLRDEVEAVAVDEDEVVVVFIPDAARS